MAGARVFVGEVKLINADDADTERLLGFLRVQLHGHDDDRGSTWSGRVMGSDYLVWGANQQKLTVEFPDGERAQIVLRSGGTVRGLGDRPSHLS